MWTNVASDMRDKESSKVGSELVLRLTRYPPSPRTISLTRLNTWQETLSILSAFNASLLAIRHFLTLLLKMVAHVVAMDHGEPRVTSHDIEMRTLSSPGHSTEKDAGHSPQEVEADSLEESARHLASAKSTPGDDAAMRRMGKEQQLIRSFRVFSVTSFTAIATAAWELGLFLITPGLQNGGRTGLLWSTVWGFVGFGPVYLSMAEMASMAPIAGAQYHWVSEFAPEKYQRILSYITGYVPYL